MLPAVLLMFASVVYLPAAERHAGAVLNLEARAGAEALATIPAATAVSAVDAQVTATAALAKADLRGSNFSAGQVLTVDLGGGVKMELVWIPAGAFMMGSNDGDSDEGPMHQVMITAGFWMGKYEVTQAQWKRVMLSEAQSASGGGDNPSHFKGADLPAEQVAWDDCQKFIAKLNSARGQQSAARFRLPNEAEWEYACRAGTRAKYSSGDNETDLGRAGWYDKNSGDKTHPVGGKMPNAWGLYDMHGNVWEWCADWYAGYGGNTQDPIGPGSGSTRVLRGGSWFCYARGCRSANRVSLAPSSRRSIIGLRVVLSRASP